MDSGHESVTVEILRSIRDEIVGLRKDTNERFAETHGRIDQTNARLDFLAEGQIRLANEVHELKGEVHELKKAVAKQGERFEHFLETSGGAVRDLQERVRRLEDTVFHPS